VTPPSSAPTRTLKARAIGYLARREYSRAELRDRLLASGASRDDVDPLLDELTRLGYLSDERYAQGVVRQKSGTYSKRAIAGKLKAMGVSGEAATQALADHTLDDEQALIALWRRRFGQAPKDDRDKARQVRYLQSRGFALSAILKLLREPPADSEGHS
jgi:regulatory protein